MRKFMTAPLVCLWALAVIFPLRADEKPAEKKDAAAEKKGGSEKREARIKALMEQMEKIQRALAEESAAFPAGAPADLTEMQKKMAAEYEKMMAATREPGDQARKIREEMMRQFQQRGGIGFAPGSVPGGQPLPGGPGDPSQLMLQQMKQFLIQFDASAGEFPGGMLAVEHDALEIGQKMVIAGLEVQLKGLAARINATEDKEAKQKLTAEFRELVEKVVEGRAKLRERTIVQLEKRVAELKRQGQQEETADQVARRLLEAGTNDAKESGGNQNPKEAKKPETKANK